MTIDEIDMFVDWLKTKDNAFLDTTDVPKVIECLEELKSKRKMLNFLFEVINPNDMEVYMRMYYSTDTKECVKNDNR